MIMATNITKDVDNFLRIVYLNYRVGTKALRSFFDNVHPNLPSDLSSLSNKAILLNLYKPPRGQRRILYQDQWNILYPPSGSHVVSSADLDVTLMVCLLRNLPPKVNPPINGFDALPQSTDLSRGAHIARIKYYTNFLVSHSKDGKISDTDFNTIWIDLEMAIIGLGNQHDVKDAAAESKSLDYNSLQELVHIDTRLNYHMNEIAKQTSKIEKLETTVEAMVKDKVPIEIRLMSNKTYVPLYLELLESGSEKKRDIRLVVVGKKGTGKSSLLKRLFGEEISNREFTSTNGIEIHRIRCKANYNDGIWYKLEGKNEETELHSRLLKPYEEMLTSQGKQPIEALAEATGNQDKTYTPDTILYMRKSKELTEAKYLQSEKDKPFVPTEHQPTDPLLEQAFTDIETMLKSKADLYDKEEYATLLLWDFAGDEEFYHTHQTFLSPDAIYLVVTKLNEVDNKEAQVNN